MRLSFGRSRFAHFLFVAVVVSLVSGSRAAAQEPPPRIPWYVLDLHGSFARFPSSQQLADSRNMQLSELPGSGLGGQVGLHLYPLRWRAITFGIGGEAIATRARQTPPVTTTSTGSSLRSSEEKFISAAPQLSFNFGTGHGWSYISGGIGLSQWSIVPEGQEPFPADTERRKTINYGGGARWFAKDHLAFSFDVRFYAMNPTPGSFGAPETPRTTLLVINAGVSVK